MNVKQKGRRRKSFEVEESRKSSEKRLSEGKESKINKKVMVTV